MASEYIVVTVSGQSLIIEESFTESVDAANLLASGTGNCIMHGYNASNP